MLYITTRNKFDTFTAHRANQSDRSPDGGLYLPFRMPKMEKEDILALKDQSFGQRVANVLNLFFSTQFSAWDIEVIASKNPVKLVPMSHRILVAETWHNLDWDFAMLEKRIAARICGYEDTDKKPTSWVGIAIRIAVLFGIYGELLNTEHLEQGKPVDIAVATENFETPMAAWYAREIGLPLGNIVCCHDNSCIWDLLHQGEVRTEHGLPENLERLISGALGIEECLRFCEIYEKGRLYMIDTEMLDKLRKGLYAAVVSSERQMSLIPSVYRMNQYIMGPQTVMAYGGLQDYRARTGENGLALVLSNRSPIRDFDKVSSCMQLTEQELRRQLGV